jgi:hypothetical protein
LQLAPMKVGCNAHKPSSGLVPKGATALLQLTSNRQLGEDAPSGGGTRHQAQRLPWSVTPPQATLVSTCDAPQPNIGMRGHPC